MTSRGQCPMGVVFVNVFTPPPPLQEILYPRLHTIRAQPPLHMFLLSRMGIVSCVQLSEPLVLLRPKSLI